MPAKSLRAAYQYTCDRRLGLEPLTKYRDHIQASTSHCQNANPPLGFSLLNPGVTRGWQICANIGARLREVRSTFLPVRQQDPRPG